MQETTVAQAYLGTLATNAHYRRHHAHPDPDLRWLNPVAKDPGRSLAGPNFRRAGSLSIPPNYSG